MVRFFLLQIFYVFLFFSHIQPLHAAVCYIEGSRIYIEGSLRKSKKLQISEKTLGVALVIGNGAYQSRRLRHPVKDATDIARLLGSMGFSIALLNNKVKTKKKFRTIIDSFIKCLKINKKLVAFFYFSGYGKYVEVTNYLLPLNDINMKDEIIVEDDAYSVKSLFKRLGKYLPNNRKVFILDACRKYPKFSLGDGLAEMKMNKVKIDNYIVSFPALISTINERTGEREPSKTVISDQWETNSLYVRHLLKALEKVKKATDDDPMRIENIFKHVINDSMEKDIRNRVHGKTRNRGQLFIQMLLYIPHFVFIKNVVKTLTMILIILSI